MTKFREDRVKLEETVDRFQKQLRDMQHERQKCSLEIKVCMALIKFVSIVAGKTQWFRSVIFFLHQTCLQSHSGSSSRKVFRPTQ